MKVYLSKLWIVNCIGAVVLIIAVVIFSIYSCFWCAGRGMDELIPAIVFCAFSYLGITVWLLCSYSSFIRYVDETNGKLVMYSFRGKYLSGLDPKADFYYEISPMRDGSFPYPDYIILSNSPFDTFPTKKFPDLERSVMIWIKMARKLLCPVKITRM